VLIYELRKTPTTGLGGEKDTVFAMRVTVNPDQPLPEGNAPRTSKSVVLRKKFGHAEQE
jgi:hypothetical protein